MINSGVRAVSINPDRVDIREDSCSEDYVIEDRQGSLAISIYVSRDEMARMLFKEWRTV